MALSRDWTAAKVWRNAVRGLPMEKQGLTIEFEKYEIINLFTQKIVSQFFDLMASAYLVETAGSDVANAIDISALRIMRSGQQMRMTLFSSVTKDVTVKQPEEVDSFIASALQNSTKIVWTLVGDKIKLAKGAGLASYGLTIRYPRVPTLVTADTDLIDLPDGPAPAMLVALVREEVASRINFQVPDTLNKIETAIRDLYNSFGVAISNEMIKEKANDLK